MKTELAEKINGIADELEKGKEPKLADRMRRIAGRLLGRNGMENHRMKAFVDQCCVISPTVRVETVDIYKAWKDATGGTMGIPVFAKYLRSCVDIEIKQHSKSGKRYYVGIGLKPPMPVPVRKVATTATGEPGAEKKPPEHPAAE